MQSSLSLEQYSDAALSSAVYSDDVSIPDRHGSSVAIYPFLKLAGEAGEVCEKMGKLIRDQNGIVSYEARESLIKELGDVLWYVNACASELGATLTEIAQGNLDKLSSRAARGTLHGSGDDR